MTEFCNPNEEMDPIARAMRAGEATLTQQQRQASATKPDGWLPLSEEMDAAARNIRAQSQAEKVIAVSGASSSHSAALEPLDEDYCPYAEQMAAFLPPKP